MASPFLSNSEIQDNRSTIILNKLSKTYKTYKSVKANFKINCNKLTKSEIVKTIIKIYEFN